MTVERALAIDVGTNTVLGAVGENAAGALTIRYDAERIVGLGRGVDRTGRLESERIEAALEALAAHVRAGRALGCTRVSAVGTSALRDAANREAFLAPAREILGTEVEVISGLREAELTFAGATVGLLRPISGPLLVVDIGGGSTELVWGQGEHIELARSLDVGSVRLFERFFAHDPPSASELLALDRGIAAALSGLPSAAGRTVVMLAGTASSVAMLARGEIRSAHGDVVSEAEAARIERLLSSLGASARRQVPGMVVERADVLVAGARLFLAILRWAGAQEVVVSEGGVRFGLLREALSRGGV